MKLTFSLKAASFFILFLITTSIFSWNFTTVASGTIVKDSVDETAKGVNISGQGVEIAASKTLGGDGTPT